MCADMVVTPITGALGAEVTGADLARLSVDGFHHVQRLVREHLVVVFPGQGLTPATQIELAQRFGTLQVHPYHGDLDGPHPELLVMQGHRAVADFWHTDETFEDQPPTHSILRIVACPPSGGDTLWTNQYLAYEALSPRFRAFLEGVRATHITPDRDKKAEHPAVLRHPETGRHALYVNRQFTEALIDVPRAESRAVLDMLFDLSEQPDFQCRYRWRAGDVAIWDNRCTQHRVAADYTGFRHTERIAVVGDQPDVRSSVSA